VKRALILGDLFGRPGRRALSVFLNKARVEFKPDIVMLNGENAAGGFGLTEKVFFQLHKEFGIDVVTMGNHWHDKAEIHDLLGKTDRIVLPANMSNVSPEERGLRIFHMQDGTKYAVVNMLGKVFMKGENRCPFATADRLLTLIPDDVKIRFLDMHAEATSEKQALAHHLTGKFSMVYGTHSHVPTADARILEQKTGYITDVGMTGPYDSVVGIRKESSILRMRTGIKKNFEPADKDLWLTAVVTDIDENTGFCSQIKPICWKLSDTDTKGNDHE
jgi:metallophosphoesterase (TIGR00282 family)